MNSSSWCIVCKKNVKCNKHTRRKYPTVFGYMLSEERANHFPIDLYPRISLDGKILDTVHDKCMKARYEEEFRGHRSHQKYSTLPRLTNQTVIIIISIIIIICLFIFFLLFFILVIYYHLYMLQ